MRAALVAEYRKLVTTRMWWLLLIVLFGYLLFMGVVLGFSLTVEPPEGSAQIPITGVDAATSVYSVVNGIGYVFPLVVGSLLMTGEFRHKTITQSLLVEPRRTVFLGAKLLATVPIGLLYGVVAVAAVVLGGAPLLAWQGDGAFLTDPEVVKVLLLGVVAIAMWAIIGVAFGSLVPNQIAAIVVILALTQFVEPIARVALASFDATAEVSRFLPAASADALIGASFFAGFGSDVELLPRWGGLLMLLAYAAVLAVLGRLTTLRRDIG